MGEDKFRLVTWADFDGVVAGGLLIELDIVDLLQKSARKLIFRNLLKTKDS